MHYYKFNIGDYASHTARLSPMEDLAYRRLLDLYYLNERPFTGSVSDVAREIGLNECLTDVEYVLNKYFTLSGDTWSHGRVELEIERYQKDQKAKSRAGKASAKARKQAASEQVLNSCGTDVQPTINQEPLTTNHKPVTNINNTVRFIAPTLDEVRAYCDEKRYTLDPERFINFYESKGWMVGKTKMKKWKAALSNWEKRNSEENKRTGDKQSRSASLKHETFHGDF